MKKILTRYAIIFIALYLVMSFVFMNFNPMIWGVIGRIIFVVGFIGLTVISDLLTKK